MRVHAAYGLRQRIPSMPLTVNGAVVNYIKKLESALNKVSRQVDGKYFSLVIIKINIRVIPGVRDMGV